MQDGRSRKQAIDIFRDTCDIERPSVLQVEVEPENPRASAWHAPWREKREIFAFGITTNALHPLLCVLWRLLSWCCDYKNTMKFLGVASILIALSQSSAFVTRPSLATDKALLTPQQANNVKVQMSTEPSGDSSTALFEDLSLPARPGRPLKVAIAGGGVGGLTAALYMLKKGFDVTVYEKTAAFARFGGPIQFASNALSVLKEIDDTLFERVMDKFTFTGTRACGIKDGLRADGSFRMTEDSLDYVINPDAPADWFVKFPLKECADLYGLPYTGVIDRPDLQEILIDECKKLKPDFIQNGNPVEGYTDLGKGNGVSVNLADGSTVDADILVGSDGIWSAVRAQMYGEEVKKSTSDLKRRQGCNYSGYTVFAGETVLKTNDYYETGYKVYIGPKRYFVTSDVGDGRVQWYAFFALPPGTKKAPSGWGGSVRDEQDDPQENLVEYIKSLHEGWTDEIMTVLDATPPESVEQRDLYDRAPEFLRSWADGNVVLMGDAVHPMVRFLFASRIVGLYKIFVSFIVVDSENVSFRCQTLARADVKQSRTPMFLQRHLLPRKQQRDYRIRFKTFTRNEFFASVLYSS